MNHTACPLGRVEGWRSGVDRDAEAIPAVTG